VSEPRLLRDSLNVIVGSSVRTKADLLAVEFTMKPEDVENLTSLPPGWFSVLSGEIVHLKRDNIRTDTKAESAGVVVPFVRR